MQSNSASTPQPAQPKIRARGTIARATNLGRVGRRQRYIRSPLQDIGAGFVFPGVRTSVSEAPESLVKPALPPTVAVVVVGVVISVVATPVGDRPAGKGDERRDEGAALKKNGVARAGEPYTGRPAR